MATEKTKRADLIGTVNPRMDTKVGDLVQVRSIQGYHLGTEPAGANVVEVHRNFVEVLVTHTIKVTSVDQLGGHLWCKGLVVESDGHTDFGREYPAYLGAL